MAKPLDPRTVAIMATLQDNPYPMNAAQLAESTEIPYTTLSRRLAILVAEGTLAIDTVSGPKGRTLYYKISNKPPTFKWMKGGTAVPEDVTLDKAYQMAKEFPAVGAIDVAIGNILIEFVERIQADNLTAEELKDLKKKLDALLAMVTDRVTVITSIQSSPMWTMRAVETIKGGLSF